MQQSFNGFVNNKKDGGKVALTGNAVEADVISGKTFYGSNIIKKTGTNTNKKWASGSTSATSTITVSGLSFRPKYVFVYTSSGTDTTNKGGTSIGVDTANGGTSISYNGSTYSGYYIYNGNSGGAFSATITNDGFTLNTGTYTLTHFWFAVE